MNTYLKLIGGGVLVSIVLSAWALFEITSMKTDIVAINKDISNADGLTQQF